MDSIAVLPNPNIENKGSISSIFLGLNIDTFQAACVHVKAMPYGTNSNNEDSLILFEEGQGTCTTKHGAIARLAQELNLTIYKSLGFYRLNDTIVTGVNDIIHPHGLDFIPQIHCFLEYEDYRVDLTEGNCNGKNKTIEDYDFVVRIEPDPSYQKKADCYLEHLRQYYKILPQLQHVGEDRVLELLEACDRQVKYQCSILSNQAMVS